MKKICRVVKENICIILISLFSSLSVLFFITTWVFISISTDLSNVVQENNKKIGELESEVSRQEMIASDWYNLWLSERDANEWLWDMYYSNVSSYDGEFEYFE